MYILSMSEEELRANLQLIDIAVKAQGLAVVQNALVLATKFEKALQNPLPQLVVGENTVIDTEKAA